MRHFSFKFQWNFSDSLCATHNIFLTFYRNAGILFLIRHTEFDKGAMTMEALFQEYLKAGRDIQTFWENRVAQAMDEFAKSQTFVNTMTRSLEQGLDMRKMWETNLNRWAETCQFVTKRELDEISRRLYDQNVYLDKITTQLADIAGQVRVQTETVTSRKTN